MTANNQAFSPQASCSAFKRARLALAMLAMVAACVSCALGGVVGQAYADASFTAGSIEAADVQTQANDYDTSWYDGKESPYTISNIKELKGLAYLVNSGTDTFEGKEVYLAEGTWFTFDDTSIEPIGTEEHPFQGTFDGARGSAEGKGIVAMASETCIQNLTVSVGDRLHYIGLFGYAGEHATIRNLTVYGGDSAISVVNEEDGQAISNVGAIAGYLGGSIENCYSSVDVSVTNNGAVPEKEGKSVDELCIILSVGGLVGELRGDMTECVHADTELAIASTSDVSDNVPYIGVFIGGLVGLQGVVEDASIVPCTTGCVNSGPLAFKVSGKGGIDRFNQPMYSKSSMVGGIVGYTMGDVHDCSNSATIDTSGMVYSEDVYDSSGKLLHSKGDCMTGWGATTTGGIVGSLRGPTIVDSTSATGVLGTSTTDPGYDVWLDSDGGQKAQAISIERCSNTAHVIGLSSVGGICGSSGAFTEIAGCANSGQIDGTRWNKPCPAGIVGIANGDIAYCSNTGRIETIDGGGFYASGIVALFTTYNSATTEAHLLLSANEMYGCYVTGNIVSSQAGYRTAVLAGENDGYIHDNCFLPNLTLDKIVDEEIFGDKQLHSALVYGDESRGTLGVNYELSPADLRGSKGISLLNRHDAMNGSWRYSYVPNPDEDGYPLLAWQLGKDVEAQASLQDVVATDTITLTVNPSYSAAVTPIPEISLQTVDGVTLYQNSDFKVIPQEGARAVSSGGAYEATIVGMNYYEGTLDQKVAYDIGKCDIGSCTVLAGSQMFNWKPQDPAWVKVIDDSGNAIPSDEYTWEKVGYDPDNVKADSEGKYHDYTNVHSASYRYDIKVTASDESESYEGSTTQAVFHIEWALLVYEKQGSESTKPGCDYDKVIWGDQEWDFEEALDTKGFVKIKYTGSPIQPTIANPTYLGVALRDGTNAAYWKDPLAYDFRYVYGNPNAVNADATGTDCIDATGSGEQDFACMTVRFTSGGNFTNYTNVFFEITPASIEDDVAIDSIASSYAYAGKPVTVAPVLTYNGMTLEQGKDYLLTYKNNTQSGTASVTIAGIGNYSGSVTKTFTITKGTQAVKASNKTVKLKASKLKKKALSVNAAKVGKVSAKTQVTYTGASNKRKANFKVSKKGVITVKKGTPKGTYKVTIKAKAKADSRYLASKVKKFTITIKVK